jgi:SAM-dependent methyltransferase
MYQSLKNRGRAASDYYAGREEYFSLSPAGLTLLRGLEPLVKEHCRGRVLDAGAGRGAYRGLLLRHAREYVGMDIGGSSATDVIGDAQILPFANASFDTVFCSQVLEHVPEPWLALAEFRRVLRPGGKLILSVPHISWLHNEPHDYYRYTRHGLVFLLRKSGLAVASISAAGGLLSLLGHVASTMLVSQTFGLPVVHGVTMTFNRLLVRVIANSDSFFEKNKIFALNYVAIGERGHEEDF